jgi:phosphoglycerate dehydrogenase-like enzyme
MTREIKNTQGEVAENSHLLGPTEFDAIQDGAAFVNAVASRVDLVKASVRLVCANDEKIAKAELDRLREMKFGKVSAMATIPESPTVVWDVPGLNVLRNER